jgi:hypothetical protein
MLHKAIALVILSAVPLASSYGCSLMRGYARFELGPVLRPSNVLLPAPAVSVVSIERGYNDGDSGSCADAGILVLKVPSNAYGYRFELVEGAFDDVVFPDYFVRPIGGGELRFVWLDGRRNYQEPIKVVVRVTAISSTGAVSEPSVLPIEHPGGARVR